MPKLTSVLHISKFYLFASIISAVVVSSGFPGSLLALRNLDLLLPFSLFPLFYSIQSLPLRHNTPSRIKRFSNETVKKERFLSSFVLLWVFGFVLQCLAFFWISQPMVFFTNLTPQLAYPAYVLISILTALYYPLLFSPLLFEAWWQGGKNKGYLPLIPTAILMTILELLLPRFFDWSFGMLLHSNIFASQIASLFGHSGGTFLIFLTGLTLSRLFNQWNKKFTEHLGKILILASLWTSAMVFGYIRIQNFHQNGSRPTSRIAYIQPNFIFSELSSRPLEATNPQEPSLFHLFSLSDSALELAKRADNKAVDLLVWPESVAPYDVTFNTNIKQQISRYAKENNVPILLQATLWENSSDKKAIESLAAMRNSHSLGEKRDAYSSSFIIYPNGTYSPYYKKWYPIPFGEYFPLENHLPFLGEWFRSLFDNASFLKIGTSFAGLEYDRKLFVGPLICFDSILQDLPRLQTLKGQASLFINQGNFVWMAKSNAGLEFAIVDKFRAIENSRSMLLVTNNGPFFAYNPLGQTIKNAPDRLTQDFGYVDVPIETELTFFTRFGNLPLFILTLFSFIVIVNRVRKKFT